MIIDFTKKELEEIAALDQAYEKLKADAVEDIERYRPDYPHNPDETEYQRIQESRLSAPPMPEPIRVEKDGTPIYRAADLDAYHDTPEYKAYAAANKAANDAVDRQWDEWYEAGSKEWKAARERFQRLEKEHKQAVDAVILRAEDRQFSALGDDPLAILKDAYRQTDRLILNSYNYYDRLRRNGTFRARDVRRQANGNFRLDTTETRAAIVHALARHMKALDESLNRLLSVYIDRALESSPFVSDEGDVWGEIERLETQAETPERGLSTIRPRDYKYPNTKVNTRLFGNEITTDDPNYFTPLGLNKKKTVVTYANFVMPSNVVNSPTLDGYDERVYAAVGSCLFAGNNFIPWTTLYNRGMLGLSPKEKNRAVTADIKRDIIESLVKFLGQVTIDNDPQEQHKDDPRFRREIIRESLLFYQIREERVHGQVVEGIAIPSGYIPVLYRYAQQNGNEIITDRIESIYVEGIRYTRENMIIANATYKRVKEIQYHNDEKRYRREIPENQRTIRYDTIAETAGIDYSSYSPTERSRFKSRIDKYMKSYQKSGLFLRYEHKRDATKTFYAVVLYFEPEPKELEGTTR